MSNTKNEGANLKSHRKKGLFTSMGRAIITIAAISSEIMETQS